ncbi:hypothetical protein ACP3V3_03010 [Vibrio sp. PNB22_3_1]
MENYREVTGHELLELEKGQRIVIRDGKPKPPKHHSRKLRDWQWSNREGYLYKLDVERGMITVCDHSWQLDPNVRAAISVVRTFALAKVHVAIPA